MRTHDPSEERQRLTAHYAGLPDESLLQLAADRASLTEVANEVLSAEISRRNLVASESAAEAPKTDDSASVPTQPILEVAPNGLVTLTQFRDLPAALLAKGALDSANIPCFLIDSNMVRLDWFISNLLGGIKLQVRPEDANAAMKVLSQGIPEAFDVEGVGGYEQPHCPKCGSVEITFEALNKPVAYGSAFIGVPIPLPRNVWKCDACGQRWQEGDSPSTEQSSS